MQGSVMLAPVALIIALSAQVALSVPNAARIISRSTAKDPASAEEEVSLSSTRHPTDINVHARAITFRQPKAALPARKPYRCVILAKQRVM